MNAELRMQSAQLDTLNDGATSLADHTRHNTKRAAKIAGKAPKASAGDSVVPDVGMGGSSRRAAFAAMQAGRKMM